jgi:hypothetical protein
MDHIVVAAVVFFFVVAVVESDIEVVWVDSIEELFVVIVDNVEFDINFLVVDNSYHIIHLSLDKSFEAAAAFVFVVGNIFVVDHNAINSVGGEVVEQSEVFVLVDLKVDLLITLYFSIAVKYLYLKLKEVR